MDATYVSATQFTVVGDKTGAFVSGRRVRADCGVDGIKYVTVDSSSYDAPDTTVTIKESELTNNLISVLYGIASPGVTGSLPDHFHDGAEGSGGEMNGDKLDIDWNPENYSPDASPEQADDVDDLTAHLKGIDDRIAASSTSHRGTVELATTTEARAGSDSERAVTPAGLRAALKDIVFADGYGVRWNTSTDAMDAGIVSGGAFIVFDYQNFPIQDQMRRCVTTHGTTIGVEYYLHPEDSTKKESGESANIDGTDGQVMVEVPLFYYLICTDGDNKYFLISERPFSLTLSDSSVKMAKRHEWFEEGGTLSAKKYMSAFEGVLYDDGTSSYIDGDGTGQYTAGDKIHSVYGYKPITNETRATFRTACAVDTAYHQMGYWAYEAILLLYLTEYKSWNSQTELPGYTEGGSFNFNKVCKTGITKTLGNKSGSINWEDADASLRCSNDQTGNVVANSFRGIENFYGHIWNWLDGINVQWIGDPLTDADVYTCNNPDNFADDTDSNYIDEGIDLSLSSGYQQDLHDGYLLPESVGGSSSTYITDYFWASSSAGWCVVLLGGTLANGANAGAAARNAGSSSSTRTAGIGGRPAA